MGKKIAEDYFLKQEVALVDAEESNQMEYNDRKRKRSPSPTEVCQASPIPQKAEDEPDLDESTVILSWCKFFLLKHLYYFLRLIIPI